jgi:hypothetical protein
LSRVKSPDLTAVKTLNGIPAVVGVQVATRLILTARW